jgi:hypothetical protein
MPTPTPAPALNSTLTWYEQVMNNLANAGSAGQHAADYIKAHNVGIGFLSQKDSGALWLFGNIYLDSDVYSLQTSPSDPTMLASLAHEADRLERGPLEALSVRGELAGWKVHYDVYRSLTNDISPGRDDVERGMWDELDGLGASRADLERAAELMVSISPGYKINWLPLYPILSNP